MSVDLPLHHKKGTLVWNGSAWVPASADGSGHLSVVVSSGAVTAGVTVADGADVAEGATTDIAVVGDNTGTLSAKSRGLGKAISDVWDSVNHWFKVSIQNSSIAVTGPVTDAQLRASAVPVSISSAAVTSVDGGLVTLGAKADAKSTATDATPITAMSVLKQISASVQAPPSQAVTGTFYQATQPVSEADGVNVTLGAKADAKSTATDTTSISAMSVLKQISASVQAPPSQAVTNSGTFAVQAAEADGANVTLGTKTDAKSTATDGTSTSAISILKQISASVQAPPSQAVTNTGTFAVQSTGTATVTQGTAAASTAPWFEAYGTVAAGTAAWTSATAGSTALSIATLGYNTALLSFTASATMSVGVLTFEASDDGGSTWWAFPLTRIDSYTTEQTYTVSATTQSWSANCGGFTNVRVRLSTQITGSGTATLRLQASAASDEPDVVVGQATASNLNAQVVGTVASGASDSGNPVKIGVKAATALPSATSAANRVDALGDVYGRSFVRVGKEGPSGGFTSNTHVPATNTKATITKASGGGGVRNVATSITAMLSAGATAPTAIQLTVALIDGASGGSTYLWGPHTISLPATAGATAGIVCGQCWLPGTAATAMTLEWSAAGGANTFETVWFQSTTVAE